MAPPPHIKVPDNCTAVSATCPVEGTIYGYYPSLGWNLFFAIIFSLCLIGQLVLSIRARTWTYLIGVGLGCAAESSGYMARVAMHYNPYNKLAFQIQIVLLIFAPAFLAAGIYLVLKHAVLQFGEEWSRIRPRWYTYIFIGCDVTSLLLQSAGGAIAATSDKHDTTQLGTNVMIAGIGFQIVVFAVFGVIVAEYSFKTYKRRASLSASSVAILRSRKFRFFISAFALAYVGILVRCIYRLPELLGGWGGSLMRIESDFIACEGFMIVLAALALTLAHPAICFPVMGKAGKALRHGTTSKGSDVESGSEMVATR